MLLAEALATHKDHLTAINAMPARLVAVAVCFDDASEEERTASKSELNDLLAGFAQHLAEAERLAVAINKTNNATSLSFEGRDISLMQAVAMRDRMVLEEKRSREFLEAVDEAVTGRSGRSWRGLEKRSKDDIKRVALFEVAERRAAHDTLARRIRQLDLEMQQTNWTTQLLEA